MGDGLRRRRGVGCGVAMLAGLVILPWPARGQILFQEQGARLGNLPVTTHFGMCAGDLNGDGFEDIYHGRHKLAVPLCTINNGAGTFTIPNPNAIGPRNGRDRHTPELIDFDNDGDKDIYEPCGQDLPYELWQNDGTGLHYVDLWLGLNPQYVIGRARSAAFFDWNDDRYPDMFTVIGRGSLASTLSENLGGTGAFVGRNAESGLDWLPDSRNEAHGSADAADYDNDGDMDFFLCNAFENGYTPGEADSRSKLFRRAAGGPFADVLGTALSEAVRYSVASARWGDYDNDGDLDLYVARGTGERDYGGLDSADGANLAQPTRLEFFTRVNTFWGDAEDAVSVAVDGATTVTLDLVSDFRDFIPPLNLNEIFLGPAGVHPAALPAVLNLADLVMTGEPARTQTGTYLWLDQTTGRLEYRNVMADTGTNGFRTSAWVGAKPAAHVEDCCAVARRRPAAVSSAAPPPDDYYSTGTLVLDAGSFSALVLQNLEPNPLELADHLFRNEGNGSFTDVTAASGIADESNAVVAGWYDFDNDGDLDILVLNSQYDLPVNRPFLLYRNDGAAGFVDVAATAGFDTDLNAVITSIAVADYDRDGDLDFGLSYETGPLPNFQKRVKYYVNQSTGHHWLEVRLVGTQSNRDAIGAKLWLTTAEGLQYREQDGGFHAYGQDSMIVHWGLNQATTADLVIQWPMGGVQTLRNVTADQLITVTENTVFGDADGDGDVDLADVRVLQLCRTDSYDAANFVPPWDATAPPFRGSCRAMDSELDGDVDLTDYALFQAQLGR